MDNKSPISTHILDTGLGRPAAGVPVSLELFSAGSWKKMGVGTSNADGRVTTLLGAGTALSTGQYRLVFETAGYFTAKGSKTFFPTITIAFEVKDSSEHYHVPLLLNAHGYTTYRGT